MGGSGKGKKGKGKGKFVLKNSQVNKNPAKSSSDSDMGLTESNNQSSFEKPSERSFYMNIDVDMSRWRNCTNDELEELLHLKLEVIYAKAHLKLLDLGYERDKAHVAILMNGHGLGHGEIFGNIINNSVSYINSGCVNGETAPDGYRDLNERVKSLLVCLVKLLQEGRPTCDRSYAMKYLLWIDIGEFAASSMNPQYVSTAGCEGSGVPFVVPSGEDQDFGPAETSSQNICDQSPQNSSALMLKDPSFFNKFILKPCPVDLLKINKQTYAEVYDEMRDVPTYSEALHYGLASQEPDLEESDLIKLVEEDPDDPRNELL